jgi:hypothetical protein
MFVECGPGRLAALLGCRKDSWIPSGFFLITGVSDVKLFRKVTSYNLAFAFLEVEARHKQTYGNSH